MFHLFLYVSAIQDRIIQNWKFAWIFKYPVEPWRVDTRHCKSFVRLFIRSLWFDFPQNSIHLGFWPSYAFCILSDVKEGSTGRGCTVHRGTRGEKKKGGRGTTHSGAYGVRSCRVSFAAWFGSLGCVATRRRRAQPPIASAGENRAQKRVGHSRDGRIVPRALLPRCRANSFHVVETARAIREFVHTHACTHVQCVRARRGFVFRARCTRMHGATTARTYVRGTCNRWRVCVQSGALTSHVRCASRAKPIGFFRLRRRSKGITLFFSFAVRCFVVEKQEGD